MQLKGRCPKCHTFNKWHINDWPQLTEFVCPICNSHVAYSDARIIKFYKPTNLEEEIRMGYYRILDDPVSEPCVVPYSTSTTFTNESTRTTV